jgi:hypothetical protein
MLPPPSNKFKASCIEFKASEIASLPDDELGLGVGIGVAVSPNKFASFVFAKLF